MKDEVMELIQRDLDGDLNELEKEQLQQLLHRDPQLQLAYARLQRVSDQLANLPPVSPPYSLVDAILQRSESTARPDDEARLHRDEQDLPRLISKTDVSMSTDPRPIARTFPTWLAKVGTGAVAAGLLGLLLLANFEGAENRQQAAPPAQPQTLSLSTVPENDEHSAQVTETVEAAQAKPDTAEPAQQAVQEQQPTPQHSADVPADLPASSTKQLPATHSDGAKPQPQTSDRPTPSVPASREQRESGGPLPDDSADRRGKAAAAQRDEESGYPPRKQQDSEPDKGEKRTPLPPSVNAAAQSREQQVQRNATERNSGEQVKQLEQEREREQEQREKTWPNKQDEAKQNAESKGRQNDANDRANENKRGEADDDGEVGRIPSEKQSNWRDVLHFRIHVQFDRDKVPPAMWWRE